MSFYPAFLDLRGRRCVVVGGGSVAEHKVTGLLDAGARVTVVSPNVSERLEALAVGGTIAVRRRPYRPGDLEGSFLAIAATDDRAVNRSVWEEAQAANIPLNAVDDLPHCSFIAPSVHREGSIAVAVSTEGKSPALAVRLRERIARMVGSEHAAFLELLAELRPEVAARVPEARARTALWYRIVDSDAIAYVRRGDLAGARRRVREIMDGGTRETGIVYLVGAGPGDPGLITRRGLETVRSADVLLYDRLVHPALVEEAPPRAERVCVGKHPDRATSPQGRINDLLIAHARRGRVVVRLKGGDPFVFGRGGEECQALRAAGIRFEVVPGVSSAIAAPAAAGIPVTHRSHASAFAVVTGHECDGNSDLDWDALARLPVLVIVMGLRTLPGIAARLVSHGMPSGMPAAVIASATLPDQRTVTGTLGTIAAVVRDADLEPPATLIVGDVVRLARTGRSDRPRPAERSRAYGPPASPEGPADRERRAARDTAGRT